VIKAHQISSRRSARGCSPRGGRHCHCGRRRPPRW